MAAMLPLSQKVLVQSQQLLQNSSSKHPCSQTGGTAYQDKYHCILFLHSSHKHQFLTLVRDSSGLSKQRYLQSHDHKSFLMNSQENIVGFYFCLGLLQVTSRQPEQSKSYTWQLQSFKAFMNMVLFGSLEASTAQNAKGCIRAGLKAGHK